MVHSLESFGSADGPGVRYVIFLSGCHMRCQFCHNPDTWDLRAGRKYTASELIQMALRYRSYWGSEGGITVSGGEPLLQIDFLLELFSEAKKRDIHTTLDTSGNPFTREEPFFSKWKELMQITDLVMLDIKHIDPEKHKELTSQPNDGILAFAKYLEKKQVPVWIRHVIVPGVTDDEKYLYQLGHFIGRLSNLKALDALPYHTMGEKKYESLGMEYKLHGVPAMDQKTLLVKKQAILDGIKAARKEMEQA